MRKDHKPALKPTVDKPVSKTDLEPEKTAVVRQQFLAAATTMSWQLAIVVLVPIIGGVELGKKFGHADAYIFAGLGLAFAGSGVVMWRAMQAANRLPVPKLTAAQKRAVQRSYETEDDD